MIIPGKPFSSGSFGLDHEGGGTDRKHSRWDFFDQADFTQYVLDIPVLSALTRAFIVEWSSELRQHHLVRLDVELIFLKVTLTGKQPLRTGLPMFETMETL